MALLPGVLNQSFYEDIRDKIAQILVLEIPAQGVLLEDSAIAGIDKVYVERSIAFSEETLPALNVVFEKIDFENETSVDVNFSAEYSVQVYGSVKSTATQRGDEKSSKFVQKLAALVQGILSYGGYNRLGFDVPSANDPNGVSNRKVQGIQFFNPESSSNSEMIVRAMVRVKVDGSQSKLKVTPRALEGSDTQMVLFNSNEAYFYATDNPILPPPNTGPCEPVIVRNSDGSWTVTQLAGTGLVVPDSVVEVNGNAEGLIIPVKPVDVKVFNTVGPVTILEVVVDDNEVNIEISNACADGSVTLDGVPWVSVASGGSEDVNLVDQNGETITPLSIVGGVIVVDQTPPTTTQRKTAKLMQSGQPISYITGDAADVVYGRLVDWLTLDAAPLHNNGAATINTTTYRFTDELGGQTFTSGIILDWSTWDGATVLGWQRNFLLNGSPGVYSSFASSQTLTSSFTLGGFSGWHQPNFDELFSVCKKQLAPFNYFPFSYSDVNLLWCSNTMSATLGITLRTDNFLIQTAAGLSSNVGRPFPCRYFSLSTSNTLT